nr:MAG TPA: hypothetical protein [Caudoviricetes sp.]
MARSIFGIGSAISAGMAAAAAAASKKKNSSSSSSSSNRGSSSSSSGSSSSWLDQAKANSSAWHTADAATKKNLEQANRKLYSDHGYTYNSKTGTWSAPTASSSGGSYSGGSSASSAVSTPDWLKQAQANSQAWHTADAATRKDLEAKNRALYTGHGYSYDSKTGTWKAPTAANGVSNTFGSMLGGALSTGLNAMQQAKDKYNNVDYSTVLADQMANGATWQDVQQSLNDRETKIALNGGKLDQFSNDATAKNAQTYINNMKAIEQQYQAELDRQEQIKQQQQAYYDQMANQINQQYSAMLPSLNQGYDEAARQAYINYRTAQRDLPSQLAAAGISGQGASESALVAQNNAYNSAYNQNELARANAIQSVENNRASALAGNSTQAAQSMADLANSLYQQRQSILAQQEAAKQNVISNLFNYGNATGNFGVNSTLDAQQTLANIAYNKRAQDMQQSQYDESTKLNANETAYNRAMDQANAYYQAYQQTLDPTYLTMYKQWLSKAQKY